MNSLLFSVVQDWGSGFEGQITLTNGGDLLVENWTLTFRPHAEIRVISLTSA